MTKAPLWSKTFSLTLVVSFFLSLVFYLLMTTMAGYAVDRFAANDAQAGLASSMYVVGALFSRSWSGSVADAFGRRRVLLIALGVFTLASLGYPAAGGLLPLLVVRFAHGGAFGVAHTAAVTIVQSSIPAARRAEGTAYFGLSPTAATALGPALAIVLCEGWGFQTMFLTVTALSAVAMLIALLIPAGAAQGERPNAETPAVEGPASPARRNSPRRLVEHIVEPAAVPISLVALIIGGSYSGVLTFLNSYAASVDLSGTAATFFLVYTAGVVVTRLFAGRLQDRRGDAVVMYPSILCFAVGLVVLSLARDATTMLVAGAIIGAGFGTAMAGGQAIAVAVSDPRRMGRAVATYFLFLDIGTGTTPVVLGLLITATGFRTMYAVLAGVVTMSVLLFFVVNGRTHRRDLPPADRPDARVPVNVP